MGPTLDWAMQYAPLVHPFGSLIGWFLAVRA